MPLAATTGRFESVTGGLASRPTSVSSCLSASTVGAGQDQPHGNGLGLSIARELAQGWGGDVTLQPRAGGGTTAALSLDPTVSHERERERLAHA